MDVTEAPTSYASSITGSPSPELVVRVAKLILATTVLAAILGIVLVPPSELSIYLPSTALFVAIYAAVWRLAAHGSEGLVDIHRRHLPEPDRRRTGTGAVTNQMLVSFVNLILATGFFLGRRTALAVSGVSCLSVLGVSALMMFNLMPTRSWFRAMVRRSLSPVRCWVLGLTYFGGVLTMAVERAEVNATQAGGINEIERRQRVEQRRMTGPIASPSWRETCRTSRARGTHCRGRDRTAGRPRCGHRVGPRTRRTHAQRRGWVRRTLRLKSSPPTQTEWSRRAPFKNWNSTTASS